MHEFSGLLSSCLLSVACGAEGPRASSLCFWVLELPVTGHCTLWARAEQECFLPPLRPREGGVAGGAGSHSPACCSLR